MSKKCNTILLLFSIAFSAGFKGSDTQIQEVSSSSLSKDEVSTKATDTVVAHLLKEKEGFVVKLETRLDEIEREDLNQLDCLRAIQLHEEIEGLFNKISLSKEDGYLAMVKPSISKNYKNYGDRFSRDYQNIFQRASRILEDLLKRIKLSFAEIQDWQDDQNIYHLENRLERNGTNFYISKEFYDRYNISAFELKKLLAGEKICISLSASVKRVGLIGKEMIVLERNGETGTFRLITSPEYCKDVMLKIVMDELEKVNLSYETKGSYEVSKKISLSNEEYEYLIKAINYLNSLYDEGFRYLGISGEEVSKLVLKLFAIWEIPKITKGFPEPAVYLYPNEMMRRYEVMRNEDPVLSLISKLNRFTV